MPLLIFHCRTRLFLVIVQQGTIQGGARAQTFIFTVAGTANEFRIVSHYVFRYQLEKISIK